MKHFYIVLLLESEHACHRQSGVEVNKGKCGEIINQQAAVNDMFALYKVLYTGVLETCHTL